MERGWDREVGGVLLLPFLLLLASLPTEENPTDNYCIETLTMLFNFCTFSCCCFCFCFLLFLFLFAVHVCVLLMSFNAHFYTLVSLH